MNPGDTCTSIYGLPYATGTSRPCNIGSTSCDFAAAVEAQLNALDAVVRRTETTIPLAWIRTNQTFTVTENASQNVLVQPAYDTVVVDTDNMVNLVDFNGISTNHAGLYMVWVYIRGTATVVSVPPTNTSYRIFVEPPGLVSNTWFPSVQFSGVSINQVQRQGVLTVMSLPAGVQVGFLIDPSGFPGDQMTYTEADLGLAWLGEQP